MFLKIIPHQIENDDKKKTNHYCMWNDSDKYC